MHHNQPLDRTAGKLTLARQTELREAIAIAMASFAVEMGEKKAAKEACRRLESAVLASNAGPLGLSLLETLDARLREALGEHDLLEGRYA